jgi:MFS transporter, DHA1 family, multidrug resistance protein
MFEQKKPIQEDNAVAAQSRRWLIDLVNFCLSFATMVSFIFIPLLCTQLGASNFEVGIVGAVYGIAFLVSSLFSGWKSDQVGRLVFVRWGLLISSVSFAVQLLAYNVSALIIVRALLGLSLGIAAAATITYAFEAGANMGKFSSYGSLGWIFGALAAALVGDIRLLFRLSFLACLLAFFVSLSFRKIPTHTSSIPPDLWHVIRRDYRTYLAVFLRHLGAAAVWVILPLHFASLGLDTFWIALLWGINFAVQFVVMRRLEGISAYKIFFHGQLLSAVVFAALAVATDRVSLIVVQGLTGVAWSLLYVGALLIVLQSGKEKGTAGGIFQSTLNLCNAIGPFLGGAIAQGFGYRGVMVFAALLSLSGMVVTFPANRGRSAG